MYRKPNAPSLARISHSSWQAKGHRQRASSYVSGSHYIPHLICIFKTFGAGPRLYPRQHGSTTHSCTRVTRGGYHLFAICCTSVLSSPPWPSSRHSKILADIVRIWPSFAHLPFGVALHYIGVTMAIGGSDINTAKINSSLFTQSPSSRPTKGTSILCGSIAPKSKESCFTSSLYPPKLLSAFQTGPSVLCILPPPSHRRSARFSGRFA